MLEMEEETKYGPKGEAIADGVTIGDNIVVPCQSRNGEHFWLLLCDKPKHMVIETFTDASKIHIVKEIMSSKGDIMN
jgi:hypothetical protein